MVCCAISALPAFFFPYVLNSNTVVDDFFDCCYKFLVAQSHQAASSGANFTLDVCADKDGDEVMEVRYNDSCEEALNCSTSGAQSTSV